MGGHLKLLRLACVASLAAVGHVQAQTTVAGGEAAMDDTTLVVATRFVTLQDNGKTSPKSQFTDGRIPLDRFNATDHCIDARALEIAQEYFSHLGAMLERAGHYNEFSDDEIEPSVQSCEKLHGEPAQAYVKGRVKIVAFARIVPTAAAEELKRSLQ